MGWDADEVYVERVFEGVSGAGLELSGAEFQGCRFKGCELAGARWRGVTLLDCRFEGGDLSNWSLVDCRLGECVFEGAKLIGVEWAAARVVRAPRFTGCRLDYGCFAGLDLRHGALVDCGVREADFTGADLRGVDCGGSDFRGAAFRDTDLREADFREAHGYGLRAAENRIKGLRVRLPEAANLLAGLGVSLED